MSVVINLLPDARLAKLRAQHLRRVVTSLSILLWVIVGGVAVLLLAATSAQQLQLSGLNSKIANTTAEIQQTPHLTDALTAQAALKKLPDMYAQRSGFSVFLPLLIARVPQDVTLNSIATDESNTLTVTGGGTSAVSVDHFYEAIKAAGANSPIGNYFTGVIINDVSKDTTGRATFTLTASVAPGVFSAAH